MWRSWALEPGSRREWPGVTMERMWRCAGSLEADLPRSLSGLGGIPSTKWAPWERTPWPGATQGLPLTAVTQIPSDFE